MEIATTHLGGIASLIGSLTVVGSALIWIYNKLISKPRERIRLREEEHRHQRMVKEINNFTKPLSYSIDNLNELLQESQLDRKNINAKINNNSDTLKEHDKIINNHDDRLIVLETKSGLKYYNPKE